MEMLEYGNKESKIVLIQMIDEHDAESIENECMIIQKQTDADFLMRAFKVKDWNKELSPWKAPAVFGRDDFGEGAEETLKEVLAACTDKSATYYIGGYSLAGLFALWAASCTDVFSGVAAASPSMWFPGFTDHIRDNRLETGCVCLSLGNKEAKTKNPVMASVKQKMEEAYDILSSQGIKTVLEWNEGNHFTDPELRTAKAFAWVINN